MLDSELNRHTISLTFTLLYDRVYNIVYIYIYNIVS